MALKILLKIALNSGMLYAASVFIDGVRLDNDIPAIAFAGLALWAGNALVRPVIKLLTFPLVLITFGLFNIIINIFILWSVDLFLPQLEITGIVPLIMTTLLVSLVSSLFFFI